MGKSQCEQENGSEKCPTRRNTLGLKAAESSDLGEADPTDVMAPAGLYN